MFNRSVYEENIKSFKKVLSTEANKLLTSEDFTIVYIGRGTCPFCLKFAKKLSGLVDKIDTTIYYIDTNNLSDTSIESFREQYNIVTVPGFIVYKNKKLQVRCDSSIPEGELLDMLK